jgi:AbrB family looped-hinge helix DNA binding protein
MASPQHGARREQTKSDRIRTLAAQGMGYSDIARKLGVRYQHVWNVLQQDRLKQAKTSAKDVDTSSSVRTRLGPDGRVVIPAAFRESLGLKESDVLFARLENGEIVLLTPEAAIRRTQAMIRQFVPDGVSLVDELIEDRRREAQRESEDD